MTQGREACVAETLGCHTAVLLVRAERCSAGNRSCACTAACFLGVGWLGPVGMV